MLKAQKIRLVALIGMICIMLFMSVTSVFATDLDNLGGSSEPATTESSGQTGDGTGLMDYMSNYNPLTDENMKEANKLAGPLATAIGNITGVILVIVSALIFLITAIDLVYIAVPFSRRFLNPNLGAGQQAVGGGMSMGGGYGMRGGYGMGAMGGMGMGAQGAAAPAGGGHCWVSDEAIAAVNLAGGNQQAQPGMGAMGMGNPMGGMAQQGPPAQPTKSVIVTYLKKRIVFVVVFVICTIILFSSVLTDCGINLAQLLMNLLEKFNASF